MLPNIENLRQDYRLASLDISDVAANPIEQFKKWFAEALEAQLPEPNAMTLATATPDGKPTLRVVLLKSFDYNGFVFYTNYNSRKGKELATNPHAALSFLWLELERQVRIEGTIEKVSAEESTVYFQSRPKGSQIGAWASPQSTVIPNRNVLEDTVAALNQRYENEPVLPRPEYWGGYVVKPTLVEFWQGRSNRLHDRLQYTWQSDQTWKIERLAP
ncbi:MAG: pyridoxamine 5'-phosphate oxidase [Saprospiraceae bacterium]